MQINPIKLAAAGGAAALILSAVLSQGNSPKPTPKVTEIVPAVATPAARPETTAAAAPNAASSFPPQLSGSASTAPQPANSGMALRPPQELQRPGGITAGGFNNRTGGLQPPPIPPRAARQPPELPQDAKPAHGS